MNALLDTSIVIDIMRNYPPAANWFAQQQNPSGISRVVLLELLEGVENRREQIQTLKFLRLLPLVELTPDDMSWATDAVIQFALSHGVDAFDCLIASTAYRLQVTLYTKNLKHFVPLIGDLAQRPC